MRIENFMPGPFIVFHPENGAGESDIDMGESDAAQISFTLSGGGENCLGEDPFDAFAPSSGDGDGDEK